MTKKCARIDRPAVFVSFCSILATLFPFVCFLFPFVCFPFTVGYKVLNLFLSQKDKEMLGDVQELMDLERQKLKAPADSGERWSANQLLLVFFLPVNQLKSLWNLISKLD